MSSQWYHTSPVVLTDDVFFAYVPGCIDLGTAAQRQAAFLWSEQRFIDFAGSPILDTVITGTFAWPLGSHILPLPEARITSIDAVTAISKDSGCTCTLTRNDGCGIILDSGFGYVFLQPVEGALVNACGYAVIPFQMEVVYRAGFSTGTIADDTSLHMGLSFGAEIMLNEIVDPAANEGGPGDPGIKSYGSLGYSESRRDLGMTPWGQSARSNMIAKTIRHLKKPKRTLAFPSNRGHRR